MNLVMSGVATIAVATIANNVVDNLAQHAQTPEEKQTYQNLSLLGTLVAFGGAVAVTVGGIRMIGKSKRR
jgi:hypothetical protein